MRVRGRRGRLSLQCMRLCLVSIVGTVGMVGTVSMVGAVAMVSQAVSAAVPQRGR
jgi:hypothetical protein